MLKNWVYSVINIYSVFVCDIATINYRPVIHTLYVDPSDINIDNADVL